MTGAGQSLLTALRRSRALQKILQLSEDLTPADLRPIVHWLNTYYLGNKDLETIGKELGTVVGVRMNCLGDELIDGRPKCEPISVPGYHWIFKQEVAPISERLDFPIMVLRIPGSVETWEDRSIQGGMMAYVNQPATFLHLSCDPNIKDGMVEGKFCWGWAPLQWQNRVGSVIIVRRDKKPLLPEHAEALADFCQNHLTTRFGQHMENNSDPIPILKEITKQKFLEYYDAWKGHQSDVAKQNQISPYEV